MRILDQPIKKADLPKSEVVYDGPMIKAVVDIKRGIIGIDANMHADIEAFLLADGSRQDDLWGINFWPEDEDELVEFDSIINIRPRQNNPSRGIEDPKIRAQILEIVKKWIQA